MGVMDFGYRYVARPALFRLGGPDAEKAHHRTVKALSFLSHHPWLVKGVAKIFASATAPRNVFGLTFPNPVGLAAGADKNGEALAAWAALGFGHIEAGTVTSQRQPGNPAPRMFRLVKSQGVINRMGFPNEGATALAIRIEARRAATGPLPVPLGISIGKSKVTPLEEATDDYVAALRTVGPYADYIAINVSSPNTPGLRGLQDKATLDQLVGTLVDEASATENTRGRTGLPLLVKFAPDLDDHAVADVLEVCENRGAAGVIATNTTIARTGIAAADRGLALETGGLSGAPLRQRSLEVVRFVTSHTHLPVIGVGGITAPEHALDMLEAGAALVQLYTGLLYAGPGLNGAITRAAAKRGL